MDLAGFDFEVEHCLGKTNPADGPLRRADYVQENLSLTRLLPTLQNKLLARDRLSGEGGSTNELSSLGARETRTADICSTVKVPTAGAMVCTPCVLRSLARVLVGSEPVTVEAESLAKTLHLL
jgi:hypothetical protein